jgi:hypothetical protein
MARPSVISCSVFDGRSPRTGKRVGERHRWDGGAWGIGRCVFCGNYLEQVLEKPKKELSLEQAIADGVAEGDKAAWRPVWEPGRYGATTGWYVRRQPIGTWGFEWMLNGTGDAARFDTQGSAHAAIIAEAQKLKGVHSMTGYAPEQRVRLVPSQGAHQKERFGHVVRVTASQVVVKPLDAMREVRFRISDGMPVNTLDKQFPCYVLKPEE